MSLGQEQFLIPVGTRTGGTPLLEGTARFVESGAEFDMMKAKFPFLSRVLEVTPARLTQTL